jgi:DNA-binding GntR family transcriptional regulator
MGAVLQLSTMRETIWDEHEAIACAIANGDERAAENLIRHHAEDASRNLSRLLSSALHPSTALPA